MLSMRSRCRRGVRPRRGGRCHSAAALLRRALLAGTLALAPGAAAAEQLVDLELVLAVDASSSVSAAEFDLQMHGLAEAFREPSVIQAIRASGDLGLAVALVQWSDDRGQFLAVGWTVVRDETSATALGDEIEATPRFLIGGATAIGDALQYSIRQIEGNDFEGRRKVIDVSGDGRANQGAHPAQLRDAALAQGITINALAILNEDPTVDSYYFANVIGGTGAFVMTANDYEAYGRAIESKLIKEISGAPIAARPGRACAGHGAALGACGWAAEALRGGAFGEARALAPWRRAARVSGGQRRVVAAPWRRRRGRPRRARARP